MPSEHEKPPQRLKTSACGRFSTSGGRFATPASCPATFWLALLLPVFAWAPLTYPGFFEFHSGFVPVFNVSALARQPGDLSWTATAGQCYDLLTGDGSLAYRLALVPRALGASSSVAVKWICAAAILAGSLGMYGWARRRLGSWPALIAATVYTYWPLALATVYVRGAFAEAVFLGLMPWALWAADVARDTGRAGSLIGFALALASLWWTQAGLAIWLAMLTLAYLLLPQDGVGAGSARSGQVRRLFGWLAGLALGVAGLLPPFLRYGLGDGAAVRFNDHLVFPYQLLLANWGAGPSVPGPYDTLTFQLGLAGCGLATLGLLLRWVVPVSRQTVGGGRPPAGHQAWCATIVVGLALLSTTLAAPLWRGLPFMARTLTYPWQLLLVTGPWLAWLAGWGGQVMINLPKQTPLAAASKEGRAVTTAPLAAAVVALILFGSYSYLQPGPVAVAAQDAPVATFSARPCPDGGGPEIALLSAEATGMPGPGGTIAVQARWQALRPLEQDYTVFLHVVGPDGTLWGQTDTMPLDNRFPTSQWRPGQVVADRYQVLLAPNAPVGGGYRYLLGLYLWQTGQRLSTDGDDKVVLEP